MYYPIVHKDTQTLCGLPFCADCRLDEIAFHFSFTYYSMLGGGQGLNQLAALYLDHSVSAAVQIYVHVLASTRQAQWAQLATVPQALPSQPSDKLHMHGAAVVLLRHGLVGVGCPRHQAFMWCCAQRCLGLCALTSHNMHVPHADTQPSRSNMPGACSHPQQARRGGQAAAAVPAAPASAAAKQQPSRPARLAADACG